MSEATALWRYRSFIIKGENIEDICPMDTHVNAIKFKRRKRKINMSVHSVGGATKCQFNRSEH